MHTSRILLHLLLKDLRHQSLLCALFLAATAVSLAYYLTHRAVAPRGLMEAINNAGFPNPQGEVIPSAIGLLLFTLFLFICLLPPLLAIRVIFADPTTTTDAFWRTRPISGKILFAEKTLFLLAIVTVQIFALTFVYFQNITWEIAAALALFCPIFSVTTIFPYRLRFPLLGAALFLTMYLSDKLEYPELINFLGAFFAKEHWHISILPSVITLLLPPLLLLGTSLHQYTTRRTQRSWILLTTSILLVIVVNITLPEEWLALEPALEGKITNVHLLKKKENNSKIVQQKNKNGEIIRILVPSTDPSAADEYTPEESVIYRHTSSNFSFSAPSASPNSYWNTYAVQFPEKWSAFNFYSTRLRPEPYHSFDSLFGSKEFLDKDLDNPKWTLGHILEPQTHFAFSGSVSSELMHPKITLQELKITRVAERPLKRKNIISFMPDGSVKFGRRAFRGFRIEFDENFQSVSRPYSGRNRGIRSDCLIVLWNPVRKEAIPLSSRHWAYPFSLYQPIRLPDGSFDSSVGARKTETITRTADPAWRKDARIIVYRITPTGRRARTTLDLLAPNSHP
jgi:hypothetical protein